MANIFKLNKDKKKQPTELSIDDMYFNIHKILEKQATYNFIYGGRGNRKSWQIKTYCIENAWKDEDSKFVLCFRTPKTISKCTMYFNDLIKRTDGYEYIKELTDNACDSIEIKAGKIYLNKGKTRIKEIGYLVFLSEQNDEKSLGYGGTKNFIFEEVITNDSYLIDEPVQLDSLISTIFRNRTDFHAWLIGNKLSRINPYMSAWKLTGLTRQKEGTIDVYEHEFYNTFNKNTSIIKIACELTYNIPNQNYAITDKGQQQAIGEWETGDYPIMDKDTLLQCTILYEFVVTFSGFYFLFRLAKDDVANYFLHCERKTTKIQPNTRVIGDLNVIDNLYTRNFTPLVDRERFVFKLMDEEKIYFTDNITGADFYTVYRTIKKY